MPILAVPQRQGTDDAPMKALMDRAHAIEAEPGVIAVTLAGGFCYSDVPRAGIAAAVYTWATSPWRKRARPSFRHRPGPSGRDSATNVPTAEAVRRATASTSGRPTILVDQADNIGGGTPGDGTDLLAEMITQGVTGFAIVIADPEAVAQALAGGIGSHFDGFAGGKTDRLHGDPVRIEGKVRLLSDGHFVYRGSYMTGQIREMGRTAVIDVNGNHVVLTERKTMPFDAEQLRSVGISPETCRAIVVKSAVAWRRRTGRWPAR